MNPFSTSAIDFTIAIGYYPARKNVMNMAKSIAKAKLSKKAAKELAKQNLIIREMTL